MMDIYLDDAFYRVESILNFFVVKWFRDYESEDLNEVLITNYIAIKFIGITISWMSS